MINRSPDGFWLGISGLLLLAACGSYDGRLQDKVEAEAQDLVPSVRDDKAVIALAEAAAERKLPAAKAFPIPEEAGLEGYISLALTNNPLIRHGIRKIQALGYRVPQVTSLDDPMLGILPPTGALAETAAGQVTGGVGLSQSIPWPGKLTTKGQIAEHVIRMAFEDLGELRIATVAQTIQAFDDYYLAHVSIGINDESRLLLRTIRDVASARYRSGQATQQDVLRAEVELYILTNQLITLKQEKATAAARLNSLMYRRVDALLPDPRSFPLTAIKWQLPEVMSHAVAANPRLARLGEQIKRDLKIIELADLDYYPDLTIGFSYSFVSGTGLSPVANGSNIFGVPIGINLPIWRKRLRAKVLEKNSEALSSVEEYKHLRNSIFYQLQDTLVKIDTQYRQAVLLRDVLVPRSWQAVEVSTSAYRAGRLEFTALIDNWRLWLDQSLGYHESLAGLEQRFADLQHLVGLRLPRSAGQ